MVTEKNNVMGRWKQCFAETKKFYGLSVSGLSGVCSPLIQYLRDKVCLLNIRQTELHHFSN